MKEQKKLATSIVSEDFEFLFDQYKNGEYTEEKFITMIRLSFSKGAIIERCNIESGFIKGQFTEIDTNIDQSCEYFISNYR